MGRMLRIALSVLLAQLSWFASAAAAGQCAEINTQTFVENRLKSHDLDKRGVAIFFAGASAKALPASERQAVEAELDRFFAAFQMIYEPHAYFWDADRDLVGQKQARFDFLVVVDSELNIGSLPKYDEYLNSYKGAPIGEDQLAIADYPMPPDGTMRTPPYAFAQIRDTAPREAYTMFVEWLLLVVSGGLMVNAGDGYYARLTEYLAGDALDPAAIDVLKRTHEMIVYDCLAPVFRR